MDILSDSGVSRNWLYRYKLYHIPFWLVYHYMWWTVTIGNPITAANSILFSPFAAKYLFYVVFQALAVYFNLYFLIPRFLQKGRFAEYVTYLVLTILCAAMLIIPGYYVAAHIAGKSMMELYGKEGGACIYQFFGNALPSTLASMTFAMSIKLTKNWLQTDRRKQLLEKEKFETELKFLKYQINPHFLFNSINSIFFLIHKNPDKASSALAKFSDLLRYQLYECNDLQIPLVKEIAYLENFVALERLRQNKNVQVDLSLDRDDAGLLGIAPFILMTFVENAFKHVSKHAELPNWISIQLTLEGNTMQFAVRNSAGADDLKELINYGGIGLPNVRRRLDLIYAGKYGLDIRDEEDRFEVFMRLELSELLVPQPMLQTA